MYVHRGFSEYVKVPPILGYCTNPNLIFHGTNGQSTNVTFEYCRGLRFFYIIKGALDKKKLKPNT